MDIPKLRLDALSIPEAADLKLKSPFKLPEAEEHSPIHVEALDSAPYSPIGASFSLGSEIRGSEPPIGASFSLGSEIRGSDLLGAPIGNPMDKGFDSISPFGSDRPIESLGILDKAINSVSDFGSGRDRSIESGRNPLDQAGMFDYESGSSNP